MSNMSYCRFRNTVEDLQDCYNNWDIEEDDDEELKAQKRLIELCKDIVDEYGDEEED